VTVAAPVDELYHQHIRPLSLADRRRLMTLLAQDLAKDDAVERSGRLSLLEFEGLGAELWQGVDGQERVHAMRDEWERRR
jgi:hypothetical protein